MGAAEGVLAIGVAYAQRRHQFGRPIGSFQAVAHRLADAATMVDAAGLLVRKAAWTAEVDQDGDGAPDWTFAAMARAAAEDAAELAAATTHQVMGGYGFTVEEDCQLYSRRIRAWRLRLPPVGDELAELARRLLDRRGPRRCPVAVAPRAGPATPALGRPRPMPEPFVAPPLEGPPIAWPCWCRSATTPSWCSSVTASRPKRRARRRGRSCSTHSCRRSGLSRRTSWRRRWPPCLSTRCIAATFAAPVRPRIPLPRCIAWSRAVDVELREVEFFRDVPADVAIGDVMTKEVWRELARRFSVERTWDCWPHSEGSAAFRERVGHRR